MYIPHEMFVRFVCLFGVIIIIYMLFSQNHLLILCPQDPGTAPRAKPRTLPGTQITTRERRGHASASHPKPGQGVRTTLRLLIHTHLTSARHNHHSPNLLFQGGQRPLQEEGGRVPSDQRAVAAAARGGPFAAQSLRLQRQQPRLLARQSQGSSLSCTARQEYVECRSRHSPDAVENVAECNQSPPPTREGTLISIIKK